MKGLTTVVVACLALNGFAGAIPGTSHANLHKKRDLKTETVTTTYYQTVVWVDSDGKIINTEVNTPPPVAATTYRAEVSSKAPSVASLISSDSTIADLNQRPNVAPLSSDVSPLSTSAMTQSMTTPSSPPVMTLTTSQQPSSTGSSEVSDIAPAGMGICYDMIDNSGQCKSQGTASSEFAFLKSQGFGIVHIYDIACPVATFATVAAQNGLQLMVGINQISNLQGDLGKLIIMLNGQWGVIHTVYVGNELVNTGANSASDVASAVTQARGILQAAGYSSHVVTIDTFNVMQSNPTICSTSDYCAANAHAYFDSNTVAENAGTFVLNAYNAVKAGNSGKNVVITESGWPWQGQCNGQACPSIANQKAAIDSIIKSFSGMPGNMFLFQAYDAGYKAPGPQGVEQFFGIYDADHYSGGIGLS